MEKYTNVNGDMAKCSNISCLIKEECLRYVVNSAPRQVYANFDCNNQKVMSKFIPVK